MLAATIYNYFVGFCLSFTLSAIIILLNQRYNFAVMDNAEKPQNIHLGSVARIGGTAIFIGCLIGLGVSEGGLREILFFLVVPTLPVFVAGLAEDVTGLVSPLFRLVASLISGLVFCWMSGYTVTNVGIDFMRPILLMPFVSFFVTIYAISALINSFNIIDGLNGLCCACGIIMLTAFGILAGQVGDISLEGVCFLLTASIAGVLIWNFPFGKIFLGDCGAYFIGAVVAGVAIILPENNQELSPFASLMIICFPLYELLRSAIRRFFTRGFRAFEPDRKHFHSVLFSVIENSTHFSKHLQNSLAATLTLLMPAACGVWGIMFFNDRFFLICGVLGLIFIYEGTLMVLFNLKKLSEI